MCLVVPVVIAAVPCRCAPRPGFRRYFQLPFGAGRLQQVRYACAPVACVAEMGGCRFSCVCLRLRLLFGCLCILLRYQHALTALPRTSTSSCASALSACALPTLWSERSPAGCGVDHAMKDLGSAFGASVPDGRALRLCQQQLIGKSLVSITVGPTAKSTVLRSPQAGRNVSRSRIPCPSHRRKGPCLLVAQRAHRAGRSKEEAAQCDRRCLWGVFGSIEETSATSEAVTAPSLPFQWIPPRSV